ncbi:Mss4-like protein [Emericellopsis atlantica]|uniref:Mss4-like protein n=1 Tax=Emericellopsis atlantica TaxID=2614577 RepID=A0A9P8CKV8_9HYPO|nr:Mss4-like protein [Emericellopsis atlantica]KAG9250979.1 Mss4-like protein [Emericellopsis atlantica]
MSDKSVKDTEKFFPLAGLARDGWSTAEEATATCYCGAVQLVFPLSKPGFRGSFVCHCSDCRKITASMFTSAFIVLDTHLRQVRGEDSMKQFGQSRTVDQTEMTNFFCGTCGSLMYRRSSGFPGISILRIGTVDDFKLAETALKPTFEQWVEHKVGWLKEIEDMAQIEGQASLS